MNTTTTSIADCGSRIADSSEPALADHDFDSNNPQAGKQQGTAFAPANPQSEIRDPKSLTRLTDLAESLSFVPWLGEDVPRTIPNLLQRVLESHPLSPAQSDYTLRLLTAAVLELFGSSPIAASIRNPQSEIRNHTDPLFLRVAHRAASPNLSTLNPHLSTTPLAAPTGPYEVQLDPSGFPNSERGTVGILSQESGVRDQEPATRDIASPANAVAPQTLNTQLSTSSDRRRSTYQNPRVHYPR